MTDFEIIGPYLVALLMSIGALCIFIWGVLSGAFSGADDAALRFYRKEMENDRTDEPVERAGGGKFSPRDGGICRRLYPGAGRAPPGLAVGRLCRALHLGALLPGELLGRGRPGKAGMRGRGR